MRNGILLAAWLAANQAGFPPTILRPGQVYSEKTLLVFRVSEKIGE
ncbi:MAG TPA: hypothetical protein VNH21_16320 [Steroidobacteraceae bacterium]|jgi:hypothetical protein|nr:hypothetical protein [Steroidobacteraceae bacterium]